MIFWILGGIILYVCITVLILSGVCYRLTFYSPPRVKKDADENAHLEDKNFKPFGEEMKAWAKQVKEMPCQEVSITSFDGLTLRGKYYEYAPGAPVELMIHGYRGSSERDLPGGVQRCFKMGRSAFLVDQRGCGRSDGKTISFGIQEHRDCLAWVDYIIEHLGSDIPIILTGISMGAATVLMAAGKPLPPNVIGVIADCGFSSPREIIRLVLRKQNRKVNLIYPFMPVGARLYGGFRLESYSPMEAMKTCQVPVFFIHGEDDDFVPCDMSRAMYEACVAPKKLVTVPKAGHGLSYLVDPELYCDALREFFPK